MGGGDGGAGTWVEQQTYRVLEDMEEDRQCDETPSESSLNSSHGGQGNISESRWLHHPIIDLFSAKIRVYVGHSLTNVAHQASDSWRRRLCARGRFHQDGSSWVGQGVQLMDCKYTLISI